MSFRDRVKSIIDAEGQTVTYKQVSAVARSGLGRTNTFTNVTVKAHVRRYTAKELSGKVQEGDRQVRIPALSLSFTPSYDDKIVINSDEYNVVSVDIRDSRDSDLIHIIQVRGSQ